MNVIELLFSGIGATLIGVFITCIIADRRERHIQVNSKTITTSKSTTPTIYIPHINRLRNTINHSNKLSEIPIIENGTGGSSENSVIDYRLPPPSFDLSTLLESRFESERIPSYETNQYSLDQYGAENGFHDSITIELPNGQEVELGKSNKRGSKDTEVSDKQRFNLTEVVKNIPPALWIDDPSSKLVTYKDGSTAVVGNDKVMYVDGGRGMVLASKYDPSKWEEVEIKNTDTEFVYRLKKKSVRKIIT